MPQMPHAQPTPQGAPPQGAPPQGAPPRGAPPRGAPSDVMAAEQDAGAARRQTVGATAPTLEEEVPVKVIERLADDVIKTIKSLAPEDLNEQELESAITPMLPEGEKKYQGPIPEGVFAGLMVLQSLSEQLQAGYDLGLQGMTNAQGIRKTNAEVLRMGKDKKLAKSVKEATPEAPEPPKGAEGPPPGRATDEEMAFAQA